MTTDNSTESRHLMDKCLNPTGYGKMQHSNEHKEYSLRNSIWESMRSDRAGYKPEENYRRRTLIIEKKNGSYGFTLQACGIHFKKEDDMNKETMIAYVNHVDEGSSAAAADMKEGDIIVSVNDAGMGHSDYDTIMSAINASEARMRIVVMSDNCVRKDYLHHNYINIHQRLTDKMKELYELERRERQIIDTIRKSHCLPSQDKNFSPSDIISDSDENQNRNSVCWRPSLPSESVVELAGFKQGEFSQENKPMKNNQVNILTQRTDTIYPYMNLINANLSSPCSERYKVLMSESNKNSQRSMQSIAASNVSAMCKNPVQSYNTSVSDDLLFRESDRSEYNSSKVNYQSPHHQVMPKSWDNLATTSNDGYRFDYGYLDTQIKQSQIRLESQGNTNSHNLYNHQDYQHYSQDNRAKQIGPASHFSRYVPSPQYQGYPTENLLPVSKSQIASGLDNRLDYAEKPDFYSQARASAHTTDRASSGAAHTSYCAPRILYPVHGYDKKEC
ncbi:unnamed protein product [Leptidea sinapis]|uniref:PDZ domain-containing protein n=1 Tax=Leptidea sinapis TaxID=189913 RepID=A0A5E4QFB1_9NEOP|nr:unnamed protein product [Leptidea sinapis]